MSATVNCVVCFKEANCFGGHVHKKDNIVIAGFCEEHFEGSELTGKKDCKGCYGGWRKEMGFDKSFGELHYIDL